MKRSEMWTGLWQRWIGMFGPQYDVEILNRADGEAAFGSCRPAAKRVLLFEDLPGLKLARGTHPNEVADEMVAALRWFLPHVRDAKLDPIPLRRLLGWLEHWTLHATDYKDGIELSLEARYQIEECIDALGDKIEPKARGASFATKAQTDAEKGRMRVLAVLADYQRPMTRTEVCECIKPSLVPSETTFLRYARNLNERGLVDLSPGNDRDRVYTATEEGRHHATTSRKP